MGNCLGCGIGGLMICRNAIVMGLCRRLWGCWEWSDDRVGWWWYCLLFHTFAFIYLNYNLYEHLNQEKACELRARRSLRPPQTLTNVIVLCSKVRKTPKWRSTAKIKTRFIKPTALIIIEIDGYGIRYVSGSFKGSW